MSKTSSAVKDKYNRKTYRRYNFNVRMDEELHTLIEQYQEQNPQGLSALIKSLLINHLKDSPE